MRPGQTTKQVTSVRFPTHYDTRSALAVYESERDVPFEIRRVFAVAARDGELRGNHAHKQCTQLFVCVSGTIRVSCDNGRTVTEHVLDGIGTGLLVPPGIWAKQEYIGESVLVVLCDRVYEPDDYIRDYEEFRAFFRSAV